MTSTPLPPTPPDPDVDVMRLLEPEGWLGDEGSERPRVGTAERVIGLAAFT
jgi:hypothetical protein